MANTTQDTLYEHFVAIAGEQVANLGAFVSGGEELTSALTRVAAETKVVGQVVGQGTPAAGLISGVVQQFESMTPLAGLIRPAVDAAGGEGGIGHTLESIATTIFKGGLGMVPLVSGILGLFGGGDSPAPPPLVKYALPQAVDFEAASERGGLGAVDYDQMGRPRAYDAGDGGPTDAPPRASAPQITVNVQAMDARSFLDRSNDIAAAVRDAMLNMNSINDVVNEL